MSSRKKKRLKLSAPSNEVIELGALCETERQEYFRLSDLMWHMKTDDEARTAYEMLRASPKFVRVVNNNRFSETLLHPACWNEDFRMLGMIQFLVQRFPKALQLHSHLGQLPLHAACRNRSVSLDIVQFLVEKYPKALRMRDAVACLPLHAACYNPSCPLDVIRYLVDKYPGGLKERACGGFLPLFSALDSGFCSLEVVQYLVERYPKALRQGTNVGDKPLHYASGNGRCSLEILQFLAERNSNALRQKNADGDLPLHMACKFSHRRSLEDVGYLLEQYPNALEKKNNREMMPLHCCIECFKDRLIDFPDLLDIMKLLLPGYPVAIDTVPHFHDVIEDIDRDLFLTPDEHGYYQEIAGLLLEEIPLQEQLEWAEKVVEVLSLINSSVGVDTSRFWATEWRDVCRGRLDEIETRLAALEYLVEGFRGDESEESDDQFDY